MIAEEACTSFHQQRIPKRKDSPTTFPADSHQVGILLNVEMCQQMIIYAVTCLSFSRRRQILKLGLLEPEPCDTGGGFVVNCEVSLLSSQVSKYHIRTLYSDIHSYNFLMQI